LKNVSLSSVEKDAMHQVSTTLVAWIKQRMPWMKNLTR
jgi:hypothetical protein